MLRPTLPLLIVCWEGGGREERSGGSKDYLMREGEAKEA
jgi:hypothetical protein